MKQKNNNANFQIREPLKSLANLQERFITELQSLLDQLIHDNYDIKEYPICNSIYVYDKDYKFCAKLKVIIDENDKVLKGWEDNANVD